MKNRKQKKKFKNKYIVEIETLKFNEAIAINYRHQLLILKRAMVKDYNENIKNYYRNNLDFITGDADIVNSLEDIINKIGENWALRFFLVAKTFSKRVINDVFNFDTRRFDKIRKKNTFLIHGTEEREQMTKILESSIAENVGLIKSIPKKFHDDVLGDVMRSMSVGGNLQQLTQDLAKRSNLTSKRISLIARDQVAKATALIDRQNAIDSGFTTAIWQKSVAGMTHRKDHAEANNKEFDIAKGCLISGEYILPRMKINCKCSYKLVIKFDDEDE